jgi:addiction module HigA family antidote
MANKMKPIHPGEILEDELDAIDLSASALAKYLSVPANRIYSIINKKRSITADTALRLAKFFGTSPEFWLNLQSDFDLKTTIKKNGKKIDKEVIPSRKVA